jgi:hypothetical protein
MNGNAATNKEANMIKYIEVKITETGRNNLEDAPTIFNEEVEKVETLEQARKFLEERYGKMPGMRSKVFVDGKKGETIEVGFTHSFWNKDWSHNSKAWFQTDWVSIYQVTKETILL